MLLYGSFVQPKKDINCLDSPAIITSALCSNSDSNGDTRCYTSLARQGVISSPDLVGVCVYCIYLFLRHTHVCLYIFITRTNHCTLRGDWQRGIPPTLGVIKIIVSRGQTAIFTGHLSLAV